MKFDINDLIKSIKFDVKMDRSFAIKAAIAVAGLVVVVSIVNFVMGIAMQLLPIAILGLAGFMGYRALASRKEELVKNVEFKSKERTPQEVVESTAEAVEDVQEEIRDEAAERSVDDALSLSDDDLEELKAKPINISRLEEKEKEEVKVTDAILSQIEERKRRLQGGGEG